MFWKIDMIEQLQNGCVHHWCVLLCKASTVATFVGKMDVVRGDVGS